MPVVDLHCHLLPQLDDGSKSMAISLELAMAAVENGVTHALLTPHHMNGVYTNHKAAVQQATRAFADQLALNGIDLKVFAGQEVRINGDLLTAIKNDDILYADEGNHYLMLEFPDNDVPHYTRELLYNVQQQGITPVIVHPERNAAILANPTLLFDLVNQGCLAQLTASSYVGTFGKKVATFSRQLIEAGQVNVLASDAHHLPGRKYEMRQAFQQLEKDFGKNRAQLFEKSAENILNGAPVETVGIKPLQTKRRLFGLF
ncbi:tyrosine-protein phosphatase [Furfurilactobacillus sp. WILCCON 0119]|uniref:tyrosine-protein phosphatase n=1 Tax=Furfurilactobacillus entadae TaxID=2922307 RepID=UPI0035E4F416